LDTDRVAGVLNAIVVGIYNFLSIMLPIVFYVFQALIVAIMNSQPMRKHRGSQSSIDLDKI